VREVGAGIGEGEDRPDDEHFEEDSDGQPPSSPARLEGERFREDGADLAGEAGADLVDLATDLVNATGQRLIEPLCFGKALQDGVLLKLQGGAPGRMA
jgi:hypothetical protein